MEGTGDEAPPASRAAPLHLSILPRPNFQESLQRDSRSCWQAVPLSLVHSLGQVSEGYCWLPVYSSLEP